MDYNSNQMKKAMFLITFAVVLFWASNHVNDFVGFFFKVIGIISPFILGFAIAFIFNGPMKRIEEVLFGKKGLLRFLPKATHRSISYLITLLLFVAGFSTIIFVLLPDLIATVQNLGANIPDYWANFQIWAANTIGGDSKISVWIANLNIDWKSIEESVLTFLRNSSKDWLSTTWGFATSLMSGLTSFFIGFTFSVYALMKKEVLLNQCKKITLAFLPEVFAEKIFYVGNMANSVFSSFIFGQCVEAIILGSLFFISMTIFGFPYALIISVIISVTALIPMVGALIGMMFGILLILIVSPIQAFWFFVWFQTLQQIENNFIYPHVVGKAAGLPAIWILVAITVGGSLYGVMGIILFIPLSSVIYALFRDYVNNILKRKKIDITKEIY